MKSTFEAKELAVTVPTVLVFMKTETVLLPLFGTTKSGLPSPSTSPMEAPYGHAPVVKSTFEAKELAAIEPGELVFLKIEIVLLLRFEVTKSSLPSPSRSPMVTKFGVVPVVKSTFEAKELEVIVPEELVFMKTETVLSSALGTTKSGFPSPSMSAMSASYELFPIVKSTLGANEFASIIPLLRNVTINGLFE